MAATYILYNPVSGEEDSQIAVDALKNTYKDAEFVNVLQIPDYPGFFADLAPEADVILCGGDGTLNQFVNAMQGVDIANKIYYYPVGTGNDFARDLGYDKFADPTFCINQYLTQLPSVTVNGKTRLFINNVGFGIDGYCCEIGDKLRVENEKSETKKPVNYTKIAINGLLRYFKPRNAVVNVDGKDYSYKRVWLAPVMNGRYYGGGMMAAPHQDRHENEVSLVVFHDVGKLHALMIFPSIFKGEHIKHTKQITVFKGHDISVKFDQPTPLQIDGETILDVTSYTVQSAKTEETHQSIAAL